MPERVNLGFAVKLPPQQAIEYFKRKGYRITWDWKESLAEANAKAFTVAKATKMEVLRAIRDETDKAISEGIAFHTYKKELQPKLQKLGWWGKRVKEAPDGTAELVQLGSVHRLKTIFRTNLNSAYAAGRYKQQAALATQRIGARQYWQYLAVLDTRTRPAHRRLHGKVFRFDDPFWDTFYPPNGWNCRCRVRTLTERQLKSRELKVEKGKEHLETFTQEIGIDKYTGEVLTQQAVRYRGKDASGQAFVEAPDVSFGYNPGTGWALWDKRGALPDQVGGSGKGFAIIEPKQLKREDYGLPSVKNHSNALVDELPNLSTRTLSDEQALRHISKVLVGDKVYRLIKPPAKLDRVIIHKEQLKHIVEKRRDARERYVNLILPALIDPNEVWLTQYRDGSLRRRFIKLFKGGKAILVVVRENIDGSLLWNVIPARQSYIDNQRVGVLLYEKGK